MTLSPSMTAALIRSGIRPDLQQEAAGNYSMSKTPTLFGYEDDFNPINMWFTNPDNRQAIVTSSHTVASVLFFDASGKATVMSKPRRLLDTSGDVIAGQLGDSLHNVTPIRVNSSDITKEVVGFLPSNRLTLFGGIMDTVKASDHVHQVPSNDDQPSTERRIESIPTFEEYDTHQAVLPIAIPLFFNHGLDGPCDLNDEPSFVSLRARLAHMHPVLGDWLTTMRYLQDNYDGHGIQDLQEFPNHDELLMTITHTNMCSKTIFVSYEPIANSSDLSTDIFAEFKPTVEANIIKWFENHKDDDEHQDLAKQLRLSNGGAATPTSTPTTIVTPPAPTQKREDRAAERRQERSIATWRLFLGTTSTDQDGLNIVSLPNLSEPLKSAIAEPKIANAITRTAESLEEAIAECQESIEHLPKLTNLHGNIISTAFLTAVVNGSFLNKREADNDTMLDKKISVFNFCPPVTDSATYTSMLAENSAVTFEVHYDAAESTRSKPSPGIYTGGRQKNLRDVQSTIANMIAFFNWAIVPQAEQVPDIIKDLTDIFQLIGNDDYERDFERFLPTMQWMPHSLLKLLQGVFQARAKFATKESNIDTILQGNDLVTNGIDSMQMYSLHVKEVKEHLTKIIASAGTSTNGNLFQTEPVTYKRFNPPDSNDKGSTKRHKQNNNSNRHHQSEQRDQQAPRTGSRVDAGFLLVQGRARFPNMSNGIPLCADWSTVGRSCPHGHGCSRVHMGRPAQNHPDYAIVDRFVNTTPGVSYAPPPPSRNVSFGPNQNQSALNHNGRFGNAGNHQYNNNNNNNNGRPPQQAQGNTNNNNNNVARPNQR